MSNQIPFPGTGPVSEEPARQVPPGTWAMLGPVPANMLLGALKQAEDEGFDPRFAVGPFQIQQSVIATAAQAPQAGFILFTRKKDLPQEVPHAEV